MKQAEIKKKLLWELDVEIDHMLDALFRDNPIWFAWEQGMCSAKLSTLEEYFGVSEKLVSNAVRERLPRFSKEYEKTITFKDYQQYYLEHVLDYLN